MEKFLVSNLEELENLASRLVNKLKELKKDEGAVLVALSGDLGSGKTAFTQATGNVLGVNATITSPTFTIMQRYETTDGNFSSLVHLDAYRFESSDELTPLRFAEILEEKDTLIMVEWPERIEDKLPDSAIKLSITITNQPERELVIENLTLD